MSIHTRLPARAGVALLAALALISACSSDDSSSDAATAATGAATVAPEPAATEAPAPTEAAPAEATAAADGTEPEATTAATGAGPATGDPVHVWVIEDSLEAAGVTFPTVRAGIQARVDRINAEGGLGGSGRPVELQFCTTDFDPNKASQCARDAVADESAIAVAGSVSANGDAVLPILEEGGLANVGSTAFAAADGASPVSFPIMGGLVAATGCEATLLADVVGSTAIGMARSDTVGADQTGGLLTALGYPPVAEVVTPLANPDYSAEMAALAAQSDGIVLAQDGGTALKAVISLRQTGSDVAIVGSGGQGWTPEKISQAGDAAEGLYLVMWFATDDMDGSQQYLADLQAAGAEDQSDDLAKLGWTAFELLDQVAAGIDGDIDRNTVLAGLNATTDFDGGGLTPTIDFTKPGPLLGGAMPRFVNTSCVYAQINDGVITAIDGTFVTPFG